MKRADLRVAVGRDGADLGDLIVRGDVLGVLLEVRDDGFDREVDATLEVHRVHAGGDGLGAFPDDGVSEHGRSGGAVAGLVGGLGRDLTHHLGAHVLELVVELDLLGDGDAVLGDAWRTIRFVQDHVATLGAECHAHRVRESIDTAQHAVACVDGEFHFLGRHFDFPSFLVPRSGGGRGSKDKAIEANDPSYEKVAARPFQQGNDAASGCFLFRHGLVEHAHDVALLHDQEILAVDARLRCLTICRTARVRRP